MNLVHHNHPFRSENMPPRRLRRNMERPYTIIIEGIPDRAALLELQKRMVAGEATQAVALRIGYSICHWKDEFSRKKGLAAARDKMLNELVMVDSVTAKKDGSVSFSFQLYGQEQTLTLTKKERPLIDGEYGPDKMVFALVGADEPNDAAGQVQP